MPNIPTPFWLKDRLKKRGYQIPPIGIVGFDWENELSTQDIATNIINGVLGIPKIISTRSVKGQLHLWLRSTFPRYLFKEGSTVA